MLLDGKPDRKINSLFAAIVTDPSTGLEGIGGMSGGPAGGMQAVASKRETIEKMTAVIRGESWAKFYKFEIVEFVRK